MGGLAPGVPIGMGVGAGPEALFGVGASPAAAMGIGAGPEAALGVGGDPLLSPPASPPSPRSGPALPPPPPVQTVQPPPLPPAPPPAPPGGFNPNYVVFHDYGSPSGQIGSFNPYNALVMPDGSVRYRDPANPYGSKAPHAFQANPDSVGLAYGGPVGSKPTPEALASLQKEFDTIRGRYPDIKGIGHGQAYDNYRHGEFGARPTRTARDVSEATWRQDLTGPVLAPTQQQSAILAGAGPRPMPQRGMTAAMGPPPPTYMPPPAPSGPPTITPQPGGILEQYTQGQPPPVPDGPRVGSPENPYSRPWATGGNIGQLPLVPGGGPESPQVASAAAAKGVDIGYGPPPAPPLPGSPPVASVPPPPTPPTSPAWGRIPESQTRPTYAQSPQSGPSAPTQTAEKSRGIGSDYAAAPTKEETKVADQPIDWKKRFEMAGKLAKIGGDIAKKGQEMSPKPVQVDGPSPQLPRAVAQHKPSTNFYGEPWQRRRQG